MDKKLIPLGLAVALAAAVVVARFRRTTSLVMAPGGGAPEPNTGPG